MMSSFSPFQEQVIRLLEIYTSQCRDPSGKKLSLTKNMAPDGLMLIVDSKSGASLEIQVSNENSGSRIYVPHPAHYCPDSVYCQIIEGIIERQELLKATVVQSNPPSFNRTAYR